MTKPPTGGADARAERLAQRLRDNLAKRKAQARARAKPTVEEAPTAAASPETPAKENAGGRDD